MVQTLRVRGSAAARFWFVGIFSVPWVRSLSAFMRLDSDSTLTCDDSTTDPFQTLQTGGFVYGYTGVMTDVPSTWPSHHAAPSGFSEFTSCCLLQCTQQT